MAYTPPVGIPNPKDSFSTFGDIDQATPAWPASWFTTPTTATTDKYYIDKTHPSATNTGNQYGYPDKPRATPPEGALNAGAFVYIHAGTYLNTESAGDRWDWHGTGTAADPIWITGNPTTKPILRDFTHLGSAGSISYMVFENIEISGLTTTRLLIQPGIDGNTIDHVLVRNCILTGTGNSGDSNGINISLSSSTDNIPNSTVTYVVVYNNVVTNFGDKTSSDDCGIYVGYHTDYIWVLDNLIHDVAADGVAGSHYADDDTKLATHVFIGRNTTYANGENGIDIKAVRYLVISENTIYGPFSREQGWGIVLHSGASPAHPVRDAYVLNNTIYNVSGGIYCTASVGTQDITIMGNLIYGVDADFSAQVDALNGRCIVIRADFAGTAYIANNTFDSYDAGVYITNIGIGDAAYVSGNIFSNRNIEANYDIEVPTNGEEARIDTDYNHFYHATYAPTFFWANAARTLSYMQGTASEEIHSTTGDPKFVTAGANFNLQSSSPCIGKGTISPAYDLFATMFGVSCTYDKAGRSRPQEATWDQGACEYVSGGSASVSKKKSITKYINLGILGVKQWQ